MYEVDPEPFETHWENVVSDLQANAPGLQGRVGVEEADGAPEVLLPKACNVVDEDVLKTSVMGRIVVMTMVLSVVLGDEVGELTVGDAGVGVMVTFTVIVITDGESVVVDILEEELAVALEDMLDEVVELSVLVEKLLGREKLVVKLVREVLLLSVSVLVGLVVVKSVVPAPVPVGPVGTVALGIGKGLDVL